MFQRYNFDRVGYAQGIGVHAESMEEATKAAEIMAATMPNPATLVFRDNRPCFTYCQFCDPNGTWHGRKMVINGAAQSA